MPIPETNIIKISKLKLTVTLFWDTEKPFFFLG